MKTQINESITVEISGYAARLWQKNGRNRIYFNTDDKRFIDLDALARNNSKYELPTNITSFDAKDEYVPGKFYRMTYTGKIAANRGTVVVVEQKLDGR